MAERRYLTAHGQTKTVTDWIRDLGLPSGTIWKRVAKGWAAEEVLYGRHKVTPAYSDADFVALQCFGTDPTLLERYSWKPKSVPVLCTGCGSRTMTSRRLIRDVLRSKRLGVFCTSSCATQYIRRSLQVRVDGVTGRICRVCNQFRPEQQMANNSTCSPCATRFPRRKYASYKSNARVRQLEFALTFEEFMRFWQQPCWYCGEVPETIGIDRVDNDRGYVPANVVPCCSTCNIAKGHLSRDAFLTKCHAVAVRHPAPLETQEAVDVIRRCVEAVPPSPVATSMKDFRGSVVVPMEPPPTKAAQEFLATGKRAGYSISPAGTFRV